MKTTIIATASALVLASSAFAGITATDMGLTSSTAGSTSGASLSGFGRGISDSSLPNLTQGTQEFGISGNVNLTDTTIYNFDVSYGYFVADNWEVGVRGILNGVNSERNYGVGLFTEYNFATGTKWVPFVGLSALYRDDSENDGVSFTGGLGVKYFLREYMAISIATEFEWAPDDALDIDLDPNFNIGMRFYF